VGFDGDHQIDGPPFVMKEESFAESPQRKTFETTSIGPPLAGLGVA